jgi:hypothetical protein
MNTVHFETTLCNFLDRYLVDRDCIDMHKPECPDVADKMVDILNSFIHDAVKEYNSYPLATLSWIMYTGMALAKYWDLEWDVYSKFGKWNLYFLSNTSLTLFISRNVVPPPSPKLPLR